MEKTSVSQKYLGLAGILLLMLMFPVTIFAEVIEVRIQGFDDGVKSTKQQDYEEAVLFAKRQAIERAGVTIKSKTTVENLILQKDYIEAQSEAVLLPGYQILDIGYLENGTYSIILIGKIKTQDTKEREDADGFSNAKWEMSLAQVKEALNFLFTDPRITIWSSKMGDTAYLNASMTEEMFYCMVERLYSFSFRDGKLYRVRYRESYPPMFSKEKGPKSPNNTCGAMMWVRFENEEDILYKQYGKPTKSEEYKKIWVLPSTTIATRFSRLKGQTDEAYVFYLDYEKR